MNSRLASVGRISALVALSLALAGAPADARVGGGSGSGSRGGKTFSAPPSTTTAPRSAQPMQRTETPNVGQQGSSIGAAAAQPRRFGFGSGLMAGLLGAGLVGMLMGHGFMGGLSGLMSMMGLIFQVALIGGLIWLAFRFFRRKPEPALAGVGATYDRSALGTAPAFGTGGSSPQAAAPAPVVIGPTDYASFERALVAIQTAYGREEMQALTYLATPEMVRYFGSDMEANRSRGHRNAVSDPKLLQGDLAEAWREGAAEYATLAMRFSVVDAMVERGSGRTVSGDLQRPQEATELWTFRRDNGGTWLLSAIQQTA